MDAFFNEVLVQYDQRKADPCWDADYIYYMSQIVSERMIERIYLEKDGRPGRWQHYRHYYKVKSQRLVQYFSKQNH